MSLAITRNCRRGAILPRRPGETLLSDASLETHDQLGGHQKDIALVSAGAKIANFLAVVVPVFGLLAAMVLVWGWGFSWIQLGILLVMYVLTVIGITVGFHRLFTHRSFETGNGVKAALAILGSMALQGPLLSWVAVHRKHHQHSDKPDDPHTPHASGGGVWGVLRGFWHAHVGWIFDSESPGLSRYVGDLNKDRFLCRMDELFAVWVVTGLVLPAIAGGVLTLSWRGVLLGFIWGGLVRIFLVHHATWSVNSICHLWGTQPFKGHDQSRNNAIFGVIGFGDGWHNNHHAFPNSARHGLRWWEIDASYWFILGLEKLGLATKVKVPSEEAVGAKLQRR